MKLTIGLFVTQSCVEFRPSKMVRSFFEQKEKFPSKNLNFAPRWRKGDSKFFLLNWFWIKFSNVSLYNRPDFPSKAYKFTIPLKIALTFLSCPRKSLPAFKSETKPKCGNAFLEHWALFFNKYLIINMHSCNNFCFTINVWLLISFRKRVFYWMI